MRFLHTGDWHVGKRLRGRSRDHEVELALDQLVDLTRDERIDVVLIAGDIWESQVTSPDSDMIVFDALARFRSTGATVVAIPGNHDGMVFGQEKDLPQTPTLTAFLRNFCDTSPVPSPDAGTLVRSTMDQPGVYFTLDAPIVSIVGLYTNVLEGPGVISTQGGKYPTLAGDHQLDGDQQPHALELVAHPQRGLRGAGGIVLDPIGAEARVDRKGRGQVPDLDGEPLERGGHECQRAEQVGVPVARDDLGRDRVDRELEARQDVRLDLR